MTKKRAVKNPTMMDQYREAKEKHPDMILLFRIGDFYEAFDKDAEEVSEALGLKTTLRGKGKGLMLMCGFPHHQLETYLHKLLAANHRVAICDQVKEQP